jgi:RimJ/RimL family protein N-acetyltransferase
MSTAVVAGLSRSIRTERLIIRQATTADVEATWAFRRLTAVGEWLTATPSTLDEYRKLFHDPARLADTVMVELLPELGGQVIGDFMLRVEDAWAQLEVAERAKRRQVELGWVLDPAYTGHGYATEAVRALIRHCFDELEVHRITANCFLDNEASWRLMERVGMRRELHAVRDSLHRSGRWLDTVGYALLREEVADSPEA